MDTPFSFLRSLFFLYHNGESREFTGDVVLPACERSRLPEKRYAPASASERIT
jgi:hypothetical protein